MPKVEAELAQAIETARSMPSTTVIAAATTHQFHGLDPLGWLVIGALLWPFIGDVIEEWYMKVREFWSS